MAVSHTKIWTGVCAGSKNDSPSKSLPLPCPFVQGKILGKWAKGGGKKWFINQDHRREDNIFSLWNYCKSIHTLLPMDKVDVRISLLGILMNQERISQKGKTGLNPPSSILGQRSWADRRYTHFQNIKSNSILYIYCYMRVKVQLSRKNHMKKVCRPVIHH